MVRETRAWIAESVRRFVAARGGNVAIIFALSSLPIVGLIGASVDYSRANATKADLQAALDATALMVSKQAASQSAEQLQTSAESYFNAIFKHPETQGTKITASYSNTGGSSVTVNGETIIPSDFVALIGIPQLHINSSSTVAWGTSRLRVALVLDNTGSMAEDGKMSALKTATKNLLTQLKNAASQDGDVYVSIIPFSKDVNVGAANYNANWIDWDDWEAANGSWQNTSSCNGSRSRRGKSRCNNTQTWVPANHNTWNGCVTDRDQNYDQNVTAPNPADADLGSNVASTLFPAEQYSSCPVAMMGLNYNWTAMKNLVDSMQPNGNTNQPIGLAWGWQSLVGGGPLTAPAMDPNYQYNQIIILLSDGLNTQDRWYSAQTPVDNRMYQTGNGSGTCANIKAAGITIYTIQVNTGGDPTSTLLRNCATDTGKFFELKSSNQIVTAFNTIGTNLAQLRVAK